MRADEVRRVPVRAVRGTAPATGALRVSSSRSSRLSRPSCLSDPACPSRPLVTLARRRRCRLPRPNVLHLAGAQIEPRDVALLRLRVNDIRIVGIAARLKSVAAADDEPVAGADAP